MDITIRCASCGGSHKLPLDTSGHFSGPLPCDRTKRAELQVAPREWRALLAAERAKRPQ